MVGFGGSARPAVQCAFLLWRCPGCKLVTGSVDLSGTGRVSCGRAQCTRCGLRLVLADVARCRCRSPVPALGSASVCLWSRALASCPGRK